MARLDNAFFAERLREVADLLEQQQANPFRVRAFRRAADTIERWPEPLSEVALRGGREELEKIPGVGPVIADSIVEMTRRGGRWSKLERIRGQMDPEQVFRTLPGVGEKLAHVIHEKLGVDSLEELEMAAHDGRLAGVPGVGPRRAAMIRAALAERLSRARPPRRRSEAAPGQPIEPPRDEPPVEMLLDVDAEYRRKAAQGKLPRIAPKRFNPSGEAWLAILHTQRGPWQFTALFSNTARAHELERSRDWVVIYFHTDDGPEGQRTVVTQRTPGPLRGLRVVRGREAECAAFYETPEGRRLREQQAKAEAAPRSARR